MTMTQVALYSSALLHYRHRKDLAAAEAVLRKLLEINPSHISCLHQLAQVLLDTAKKVASGAKPSIPTQGAIEPVEVTTYSPIVSSFICKKLTLYCCFLPHAHISGSYVAISASSRDRKRQLQDHFGLLLCCAALR